VSHTREISSLSKALSAVGVSVVDLRITRHFRIKIRHDGNGTFGNITSVKGNGRSEKNCIGLA
jgi:hypothetical protein